MFVFVFVFVRWKASLSCVTVVWCGVVWCAGDFPNLVRFREALSTYDIHKFPKLDPKLVRDMDSVLAQGTSPLLSSPLLPSPALPNLPSSSLTFYALLCCAVLRWWGADIPLLTRQLPATDQKEFYELKANATINPFDIKEKPSEAWMIDGATKNKYDNIFHSLTLTADQRVSGLNAKKLLQDSGLPVEQLRAVRVVLDWFGLVWFGAGWRATEREGREKVVARHIQLLQSLSPLWR